MVEGTGFENQHGRNLIESSNLSVSANLNALSQKLDAFFDWRMGGEKPADAVAKRVRDKKMRRGVVGFAHLA